MIWNVKESKQQENDGKIEESASVLKKHAKFLQVAAMKITLNGLKYGCPMEDVLTGLSIQCRGWKSIYFTPERKVFLGVAPTTLLQSLIPHKDGVKVFFVVTSKVADEEELRGLSKRSWSSVPLSPIFFYVGFGSHEPPSIPWPLLPKDVTRMPCSVTYQSIAFALLACSLALY
ncbi:Cellulose synthase-like protein E6 [Vitis vinifera]|uniref:Cellulose synthase-like protein E6 n=1 Tax=Vitis vinifera TaxID=29760 RepID=A0A438H0X7_VITVI|nr:Cellulose synthase-like protein E6 [Vitis vinifera]